MITKTDQAFLRGYKAAEKDLVARMSEYLWRHVKSLEKGFPELAEGISFSIELLEKEFSVPVITKNKK
jgi:hypothetical protein